MPSIAPWLPLIQVMVLIVSAVLPFIAVASEETDKVLSRGAYAMRAAIWIVLGLVALIAAGQLQIPIILAAGLATLITLPLYRAMVRRLRDGGRGKGLALLGALPFAGLVVIPLLAVYPASAAVMEASDA